MKNSDTSHVIWPYVSIGSVALLILLLEFIFDLKNETTLYWVAIGLDVFLVVGFTAYLGYRAYKSKSNLREFAKREKVDLLLLFVIIPALVSPRVAAAIVMVRAAIVASLNMLYTPIGRRAIQNLNLRPSQTLALSFVGIILTGTFLLMFPAATLNGQGTSFLDALFTITSAACVVGLTVVDTTNFSLFGQGVILATIQIGGLGIMVMSASFAVLMGGRLKSRTHTGLGEIFDVSTPEGVKRLVKAVAVSTLTAELLGTLFLFLAFSNDTSFFERLWWAVFHAVSAFCNAGFSLSTNSLESFASNAYVCTTIMMLITIGGIGFFAIADLASPAVWEVKTFRGVWNRLQIQTRVALLATLCLDVMGFLLFFYLEYDGALSELGVLDKILASAFQSVSSRTAGFNTVPLATLAPTTILFSIVWMFIGANPGSTGGGIKTTTATVSIMAVRAMLLGREDVEIFGRRIPSVVVNRSLSIIFVAIAIVAAFLMILLGSQNLPFEKLAFEVVSAFGTVGLSMDLTRQLNDVGRICIILVMFAGRIGPLTLAMAVGERTRSKQYSLPDGRIAVG